MLVNPQQSNRRDYAAHLMICKTYGAKAAGLAFLPAKWRLDFAALSVEVYRGWKKAGEVSGAPELQELREWLKNKNLHDLILRSSGVVETLYDRGKFKSMIVRSGWSFFDVERAILEIFEDAQRVDEGEDLGVVVQEFVRPEFSGHLSNEYRVSPTINQWSYELEKPRWAPSRGINSKFTTAPDPNSLLKSGNKIPHQPLRSVAHYLADEFEERCHVEWIVGNNTLYLSQIDFEWPERDVGLHPKRDIKEATPPQLNLSRPTTLKAYTVGTATKWSKLKNLSDFDFDHVRPSPRIYPLVPEVVKNALRDEKSFHRLKAEMISLTGDRLVVRTDCIKEGVGRFNLPRTDTVSVDAALKWCGETIESIEGMDVDEDSYIFLFHAFLPALASAWAYAKPGNPIVIVDALWGLPDGLQVLPVDTYEVNVVQRKVVQTRSTFKPRFLTELPDGTWNYRDIKSRYGRAQVLGSSDKLEVALRTRGISDKIGENAQIMWFCGVPEAYSVGRNLPWFRSREKFDPAPRQEVRYKPFVVTKPEDLERLPPGKMTIQLSPEANLIRDETFLNAIIEVAKNNGIPVQLEGSILGHAFYRLNQEGIPVVLANAPKYYRKRMRKSFGKLVRDKVPTNIVAGGEMVKEARLAKTDLGSALAGKMIEEIEELLRATTCTDQIAELADVLEVTKGLANAYGHDWTKVEALAEKKAEERGGFQDGRVLMETALPHRNSPLEEVDQIRITDLSIVDSAKMQVEIPSGSLMGTVNGIGVIFTFDGEPLRYRVSIKGGKLRIAKIDQTGSRKASRQADLFELL